MKMSAAQKVRTYVECANVLHTDLTWNTKPVITHYRADNGNKDFHNRWNNGTNTETPYYVVLRSRKRKENKRQNKLIIYIERKCSGYDTEKIIISFFFFKYYGAPGSVIENIFKPIPSR